MTDQFHCKIRYQLVGKIVNTLQVLLGLIHRRFFTYDISKGIGETQKLSVHILSSDCIHKDGILDQFAF